MRLVLLFGVLIGFAALNLIANFAIPNSLKLVRVPAFALFVTLVVAKTLRRQP